MKKLINYSCNNTKTCAMGCLLLFLLGCGGGGASGTGVTDGSAGDIPQAAAANSGTDGQNNSSAQNEGPEIVSISLGCDLVLESIAVELGEVTEFTLQVDDESPSTLTYAANSDDISIAEASVDADGVISLRGLVEGVTTISIKVSDDAGHEDELIMSLIVKV